MKRLALGLALALMITGCGTFLEPSDLQGTWIATSIILTDADDRTTSVDVVADAGVTLSLTIALNMYSAQLVNVSGMLEEYAGEYILDGSFITLNGFRGENARLGIEVDDDTMMRLNDAVTDFDVDGDGEDDIVIMDIFLTRQ